MLYSASLLPIRPTVLSNENWKISGMALYPSIITNEECKLLLTFSLVTAQPDAASAAADAAAAEKVI